MRINEVKGSTERCVPKITNVRMIQIQLFKTRQVMNIKEIVVRQGNIFEHKG